MASNKVENKTRTKSSKKTPAELHELPDFSCSRRIVVMHLQQDAALVGAEGSVRRAGRTAGIGPGRERLPAFALRVIADGQIAGDEEHLFPIIVYEGRRGVDARLELQEPRAAAAAMALVEPAGNDLLLDAGRIAFERLPAALQIERVELVMRFVDRHDAPFRALTR